MKKIFFVLIAFGMLLSSNVFAGANADNPVPKSEISDVRKSKKIKTIQKLLGTKIGKWIVKKAIKKLQKKVLNPQKSKIDPPSALVILLILLLILLLGILLLKVLGSVLLIIALVLLIGYFVFLSIFNFDNWRRSVS